ncbi:MAG: hypothetical protein LBC71_04030 [Oscillospiraceae bacterium]|jgi:hypothetical protein|nr:hypothetical protein [Oscillospiraceae bacterium]
MKTILLHNRLTLVKNYTFVLVLSITSIILSHSYSYSLESFLASAVYITSGRGVHLSSYTMILYVLLTFPLFGYITDLFSQNNMQILIRYKSRYQWFEIAFVTLFINLTIITILYLLPIFIYSFYYWKHEIYLVHYIYIFFIACLQKILFLYVVHLCISLLSTLISKSISTVIIIIIFCSIAFLPTHIQWICLINPWSNLYFDVHTNSVIQSYDFFNWRYYNHQLLIPSYSIAYFTIFSLILIFMLWQRLKNIDIINKKS